MTLDIYFPRAVNGESIFVDTDGGTGTAVENDFQVTGGIEGKWLTFSLSGATVPEGYYDFVVLNLVTSLSELGCEPQSFRLTAGVVSDPQVCIYIHQCTLILVIIGLFFLFTHSPLPTTTYIHA